MKKILAAMALLFAPFIQAAESGGDYSDTVDSAISIDIPSITRGEIKEEFGGVYRIKITEPAGLRIEANGNIAMTGILVDGRKDEVYVGDGSYILDDAIYVSEPYGNGFQIYQNLDAGTYYLSVQGRDDESTTGEYMLSVLIDDHGNTPYSATPIDVPSTTRVKLEKNDLHDVFRIEITEPATLRIETTGDTYILGSLYIRNSSDETYCDDRICIGPGSSGYYYGLDIGDGKNFLIDQTLNMGTYYLSVGRIDDSIVSEYTLSVQILDPCTADSYECFQLFNQCEPISLHIGVEENDLGITEDRARTIVESRLRSARLYDADSVPYFGVGIDIDEGEYSHINVVRFNFYKLVSDGYTNTRYLSTTWERGTFGLSGVNYSSIGDAIMQSISEMTDEFINEYLRVNEPACD
ncbi:MAG: hypothetical protein OXC63_04915 [Aestuariivita sp.]|nr:hypothetical protein [Aestuariivita sp.]